MLKHRLLYLVGIILPAILFSASKESGDQMMQEGFVIDSSTGQPISFVHILNESTRRGYITDSTGKFQISIKHGDTLVFISLGYMGKVIIVDSLFHDVSLLPRTYKIDEVSIQGIRSYEQFKRDFLQIELEEKRKIQGLPEGKPIDIPILLDTNYIHSDAFLVFHPLSYLYYNFSKEEKSKRKVFYLERREGEQIIIDRKYNRNLVHKITGLEGDELTNFIGFCNFSHQFLLYATELDIVNKINEKFSAFKLIIKTNEEISDSQPE